LSTISGTSPALGGIIGAGIKNHVLQWYFQGPIAQIMIYNRALSQQEYKRQVGCLDAEYATEFPTSGELYSAFGMGAKEADSSVYANQAQHLLTRQSNTKFAYDPSHLINYYNANNATGAQDHEFRNGAMLSYGGDCYQSASSYSLGASGSGQGVTVPTSAGFGDIYVAKGGCAPGRNMQFKFCTSIASGQVLFWTPDFFIDADGSFHIVGAIGATSTALQPAEFHPLIPGKLCGTNVWSGPTLLSGTLWAGYKDISLQRVANEYYMFYGETSDGNSYIQIDHSPNLLTGWTNDKSGNWLGLGTGFESTCPIYRGPTSAKSYAAGSTSTWELIVDHEGQGEYSGISYGGIDGAYETFVELQTPVVVQALCVARNPEDYVHQQDTTPAVGGPTTSNGTLDANANDLSGTVTEGASSTGFTLTFQIPRTMQPHVQVTGVGGVAITGGPTLVTGSGFYTGFTVTNASATGNVYNYQVNPP
jgi:hypothetical protein